MSDSQNEAEATDDELLDSDDEGYPREFPADRDVAVSDYGTTDDEAETGESLRRRVAREDPDVGQPRGPDDPAPVDADQVLGLADEDEPSDGELLGDVLNESDAPSAEEAAVHVIPEDDEPS
jgi:hypothetical protein